MTQMTQELVKVSRGLQRPMVHLAGCRHVRQVTTSYHAPVPVSEEDAAGLVACKTCLKASYAGQTLESVRRNAK